MLSSKNQVAVPRLTLRDKKPSPETNASRHAEYGTNSRRSAAKKPLPSRQSVNSDHAKEERPVLGGHGKVTIQKASDAKAKSAERFSGSSEQFNRGSTTARIAPAATRRIPRTVRRFDRLQKCLTAPKRNYGTSEGSLPKQRNDKPVRLDTPLNVVLEDLNHLQNAFVINDRQNLSNGCQRPSNPCSAQHQIGKEMYGTKSQNRSPPQNFGKTISPQLHRSVATRIAQQSVPLDFSNSLKTNFPPIFVGNMLCEPRFHVELNTNFLRGRDPPLLANQLRQTMPPARMTTPLNLRAIPHLRPYQSGLHHVIPEFSAAHQNDFSARDTSLFAKGIVASSSLSEWRQRASHWMDTAKAKLRETIGVSNSPRSNKPSIQTKMPKLSEYLRCQRVDDATTRASPRSHAQSVAPRCSQPQHEARPLAPSNFAQQCMISRSTIGPASSGPCENGFLKMRRPRDAVQLVNRSLPNAIVDCHKKEPLTLLAQALRERAMPESPTNSLGLPTDRTINHVIPHLGPRVVTHAVPHVLPHAVPHVFPRVEPHAVPHVVPRVVPHAMPHVVPRVVPHAVPHFPRSHPVPNFSDHCNYQVNNTNFAAQDAAWQYAAGQSVARQDAARQSAAHPCATLQVDAKAQDVILSHDSFAAPQRYSVSKLNNGLVIPAAQSIADITLATARSRASAENHIKQTVVPEYPGEVKTNRYGAQSGAVGLEIRSVFGVETQEIYTEGVKNQGTRIEEEKTLGVQATSSLDSQNRANLFSKAENEFSGNTQIPSKQGNPRLPETQSLRNSPNFGHTFLEMDRQIEIAPSTTIQAPSTKPPRATCCIKTLEVPPLQHIGASLNVKEPAAQRMVSEQNRQAIQPPEHMPQCNHVTVKEILAMIDDLREITKKQSLSINEIDMKWSKLRTSISSLVPKTAESIAAEEDTHRKASSASPTISESGGPGTSCAGSESHPAKNKEITANNLDETNLLRTAKESIPQPNGDSDGELQEFGGTNYDAFKSQIKKQVSSGGTQASEILATHNKHTEMTSHVYQKPRELRPLSTDVDEVLDGKELKRETHVHSKHSPVPDNRPTKLLPYNTNSEPPKEHRGQQGHFDVKDSSTATTAAPSQETIRDQHLLELQPSDRENDGQVDKAGGQALDVEKRTLSPETAAPGEVRLNNTSTLQPAQTKITIFENRLPTAKSDRNDTAPDTVSTDRSCYTKNQTMLLQMLNDLGPSVITVDDLTIVLSDTHLEREVVPAKALFGLRASAIGCIESGTYGIVYPGIWKKNEVAIKVPRTPKPGLPERDQHAESPLDFVERFICEIRALHRCQGHPNIVKLLAVAIAYNSKCEIWEPWIVMERINGDDLHTSNAAAHVKFYGIYSFEQPPKNSFIMQTLSNWRGEYTMQDGLHMCRTLADILHFLHSLPTGKFVHRDVKPENLLVDQKWDVHLCDFGDGEVAHDDGTVSRTGGATWLYSPPEVITSTIPKYKSEPLTEKWDIWSAGNVFQEILFRGEHPFRHHVESVLMDEGATLNALRLIYSKRTLSPRIPLSCPPRIRRLLRRCLAWKPSDRPTALELVNELDAIMRNQDLVRQLTAATSLKSCIR